MVQTATTDREPEQDLAASPRPAAASPAIAILEAGDGVSREFGHVFEYLGIRIERIAAIDNLRALLGAAAPMAVIWQVAAGFDVGGVINAISDIDRSLPVMVIAEDNGRTLALLDSMIRFWRLSGATRLTRPPELGELVEFVFRAGRRSGEFRILSV